jgi:hypothetical protein
VGVPRRSVNLIPIAVATTISATISQSHTRDPPVPLDLADVLAVGAEVVAEVRLDVTVAVAALSVSVAAGLSGDGLAALGSSIQWSTSPFAYMTSALNCSVVALGKRDTVTEWTASRCAASAGPETVYPSEVGVNVQPGAPLCDAGEGQSGGQTGGAGGEVAGRPGHSESFLKTWRHDRPGPEPAWYYG